MNATSKLRPLALVASLILLEPSLVAAGTEPASVEQVAAGAARDLERSLAELTGLRERIAAEKLPLSRELRRLEERLVQLRTELSETKRQLDTRNLELSNLQGETKASADENTYLSGLLDEYVRNFESRVHITELQRYARETERARLALDDEKLGPVEALRAQTDLLSLSLDRLAELVGGTTFEGQAVGAGGAVRDVRFALLGPVALYGSPDGKDAGIAEQRLGSLEPNLRPLEDPALSADVQALALTGRGRMALDPTLGNAAKVEATKETIGEHVRKGGPVMVPILLLAAAALLVGLVKWIQLARIRQPHPKKVEALLAHVGRCDFAGATTRAAALEGPTGEMLRAALEHVGEPKELIEEVMFEKTLETRLRLSRFLSFIAISASAAPLLGLLGTVTGIMNTFQLITVFGTGDATTLSSGIYEALITTEAGLVVAIPALFLHAFLSRRSRRVIDAMEKTAVAFLNRIPASGAEESAADDGRPGAAARKVTPAAATAPAGRWAAATLVPEADH